MGIDVDTHLRLPVDTLPMCLIQLVLPRYRYIIYHQVLYHDYERISRYRYLIDTIDVSIYRGSTKYNVHRFA